MIRHEDVQAALSARIDGEPSLLDDSVVDAHLAGCGECRAFFDRAVALRFDLERGELTPPQDLSASILAGVDDEWHKLAQRRALTLAVGRVMLSVMAVVWVVWGIRLIVSGGGQAELVSVVASAASVRLGVALALGVSAWRPQQIPGVLLVVGTMFTFNVGYAVRDLVLRIGEFEPSLVLIPLLTLFALVWTWAADRGLAFRRWWQVLGANPQ